MTQETLSRQQTLEQRRAACAWHCVQHVSSQSFANDYKQLVREVASMVQQNGLGQTLAFLAAKGEEEHKQVLTDLSHWLSQELLGEPETDLRQWIANQASVAAYRRATNEALAFLTWLKRFAEAELGRS